MKKHAAFYLCIVALGLGGISCSDNDLLSVDDIDGKVQSCNITEESTYYYYKGQKTSLAINSTKRYVITRPKINKMQGRKDSKLIQTIYGDKYGRIVELDKGYSTRTKETSFNKVTLETLQADMDVIAVEYVVGDSIPISNLFYLKLKKPSDLNMLQQEAARIGCTVEGVVDSDRSWVRLSNSQASMFPTSLEASNFLFETGLFEDVDPGFNLKYEVNYRPNDLFYSMQWGMGGHYGVQAESAWNHTLGDSSITVAVIDNGIHTQHPDLAGRLHPYTYNCDNGIIYSLPFEDNLLEHGTMCAGIIAANHNLFGIAGIAPNVKLMNISSRFPMVANLSELLANGINKAWQNGADVINISWGDQGGALYYHLHSALLENAISNALTKGRKGKGCVVCFAAGNKKVIDYPGYCNPDIIVVGAIDSQGQVTSFSGRGKELDVVAPGNEIISLGGVGATVKTLDGTSFAAPHVAGIAALMLSIKPELTQKQISAILGGTASNDNWNKNSGYGRVSALRAIRVIEEDYSICSPWGSSAFATAKFYIPYLPKRAKVTWSTAQNVADILKCENDTVEFRYNFSGRSMKDEIRATISFGGEFSFNVSHPITVFNEPKILGVEKILYSPSPDRIDLKVHCTDPNAQITWSGHQNLGDFPYLDDASFMEYPNLYKSLYVTSSGSYFLSVKAENQYAYDIYNFSVSK